MSLSWCPVIRDGPDDRSRARTNHGHPGSSCRVQIRERERSFSGRLGADEFPLNSMTTIRRNDNDGRRDEMTRGEYITGACYTATRHLHGRENDYNTSTPARVGFKPRKHLWPWRVVYYNDYYYCYYIFYPHAPTTLLELKRVRRAPVEDLPDSHAITCIVLYRVTSRPGGRAIRTQHVVITAILIIT